MTTLHDRLDDLAADAPAPTPAATGELWERGRRRHRRRRLGSTAVVAAVVLAVAVLGVGGWRQAAQPGFVSTPDGPGALPSRLHEPSPWLPGTDDAGPLGQLAVVLFADRGGWTGSGRALVGVSATTGEYRFLDLPDLAPSDSVALSRDGRRLAYWTTGGTTGSPHSSTGPVTGIAVYDAGTGDVVRHPVPTVHGLSADWLRWADSDRLLAGYGHWRGGDGDDDMAQGSARSAPLLVWDTARDQAVESDIVAWDVVDVVSDGTLLTTDWESGYRLVDVDAASRATRFTLDTELSTTALTSPDGRRVVGVLGGPSSANPNRMVVGGIGEGGPVRMRPVPHSRETFAPLAWVDGERVAVTRRVDSQTDGFDVDLVVVDVATGKSDTVTRHVEHVVGAPGHSIALDLLGRPSVDRPAPPEPWNPRAVAGWSLALVLAGVVALVQWRRRVRP